MYVQSSVGCDANTVLSRGMLVLGDKLDVAVLVLWHRTGVLVDDLKIG